MHQMLKTKLNIENISIALIWLFHVSGILGIIYGNSNWFISFTPLNLTLNFLLLLINCKVNKRVLTIIILGFFYWNDYGDFGGSIRLDFWRLSIR